MGNWIGVLNYMWLSYFTDSIICLAAHHERHVEYYQHHLKHVQVKLLGYFKMQLFWLNREWVFIVSNTTNSPISWSGNWRGIILDMLKFFRWNIEKSWHLRSFPGIEMTTNIDICLYGRSFCKLPRHWATKVDEVNQIDVQDMSVGTVWEEYRTF